MTAAPDADSIAEFAAALRALRLEAGSPTLSRLQHETRISRSVLSEAFAGRRLPSARTVDGIVRIFAADGGAWVRRRDAIVAVVAAREESGTRTDPPILTPSALDRRLVAAVAATAFVVGALLTVAILRVTDR